MSREVQIEVPGITRNAFILRGALAAGAVYGAGAVTPLVTRALAQAPNPDAAAVNLALAVEQLEAAFYAAALGSAGLSPAVSALAHEFAGHETAHVDTLKQLVSSIGGKPVPAPKAKFKKTGQAAFLKAGIALEDFGVAAYNGAIPALTTPDIVGALGAIVQVEARHAAALRFRAGVDPAPKAFDPVLTPQQVPAALKRLAGG
jgi:rubrerythrin